MDQALSIAALDGAVFMEVADQGDATTPGVAALGVAADDRIADAVLAGVQLVPAVLASPSAFEDLAVGADQEVITDVGGSRARSRAARQPKRTVAAGSVTRSGLAV